MKKVALYFLGMIAAGLLTGCQLEEPKNLKILETNIDQETSDPQWKEVKEGINYADFHVKLIGAENEEYKDLLVAKINPQRFIFSIYQNYDPLNAKTIEQIHKEQKSLLTFNGQYFTEDFKPTGLLISDGAELRALSPADLLNGILAIDRQGGVEFFEERIKLPAENYAFALQSGPVLLGNNSEMRIEKDTGNRASRTVIGLDREGNIVLIVLKQSLLNFDNAVSLYEMAYLLKNHPLFQDLGLHSVLNLDGGTSTGVMIGEKYYPEMEKVQNMVLVKER